MRIVVTGASGNIGTSVVRSLARLNEVTRIVGVARRPPEGESPGGPKVEWRSADLALDDLDAIVEGADAVVHLAWMFHPTRRPVDTWRGNVLGSMRLFDAVARANVGTLVYASSIGAYSPLGPADDPDRRVDETWPTHALPVAAYGREKSYIERVLDAFDLRHEQIRVARIRSAFVFKEAAAPEQRRIFAGPLVPGRLVGGGHLPIVPVPRGIRLQAVHASDLADAFASCVVRPVHGAFNVAAEPVVGPVELSEVLGARVVEVPTNVVRSLLGSAFRARAAPAPPGLLDLFLSLPTLDTTRVRRELGWEPQHSSLDAIESFLTGLREPTGDVTPRLDPHAGGPLRIRELLTGVGGRD